MRRTVTRKRGEDRVPMHLLLPVSIDKKLREYVEADGCTITDAVLKGINLVVSGVDTPSSPETDAHTLRLELPPDTIERLEKLAPQLHARNAAAYAEWLLNASSDKTKKQVLAFVFSELADESANGESDNNHTDSGNAPSPKTKRARKVA